MSLGTLTIHQLITDVMNEFADDVNEDEVLSSLMERTPDEFVWEFYRDAARPLIRTRFRNRASAALRDVFHPRGASMPGGTRSTKVRQQKDVWQKMRDQKWIVNGQLKRLGDCTCDDLDVMIAERETLANDVMEQAERLRKVKKMLEAYRADVVDDIPPTVGLQFLQEKK